jgi:hypothetical protein
VDYQLLIIFVPLFVIGVLLARPLSLPQSFLGMIIVPIVSVLIAATGWCAPLKLINDLTSTEPWSICTTVTMALVTAGVGYFAGSGAKGLIMKRTHNNSLQPTSALTRRRG